MGEILPDYCKTARAVSFYLARYLAVLGVFHEA